MVRECDWRAQAGLCQARERMDRGPGKRRIRGEGRSARLGLWIGKMGHIGGLVPEAGDCYFGLGIALQGEIQGHSPAGPEGVGNG